MNACKQNQKGIVDLCDVMIAYLPPFLQWFERAGNVPVQLDKSTLGYGASNFKQKSASNCHFFEDGGWWEVGIVPPYSVIV